MSSPDSTTISPQQPVDALRDQLRKAAGHLRKLSAENDHLTQEIDTLSQDKAQLHATIHSLQTDVEQLQLAMGQGPIQKTTGQESTSEHQPLEQTVGQLQKAVDSLMVSQTNPADQSRECTADALDTPLPLQQRLERICGQIKTVEPSPGIRAADGTPTMADQRWRKMASDIITLTCEQAAKEGLELPTNTLALSTSSTTYGDPDQVKDHLIQYIQHILTQYRQLTETLKEQVRTLQGQVDSVVREKETVSQDYHALLDKVHSMKEVLTLKLKGENQELSHTRDELERVREQCSIAQEESATWETHYHQIKDALGVAQYDLSTVRHELDEARDQRTASEKALRQECQHEVAIWKDRVTQLEKAQDAIRGELHNERNQREEVTQELQHNISQVERFKEQEAHWQQEKQALVKNVDNLRIALSQLQNEKDDDLEQVLAETKRKLVQAEATRDEFQTRASTYQTELEALRKQMEDGEKIRTYLKDYELQNDRLRDEVTFLELPHSDTKRLEVLQLMSNILNFSTQEQERVGLKRSTVLSIAEGANPIDLNDESLANQWISFLLKESNTRRHQSTPPEL
ncbi:hypothetical protein IWQ61_002828 [Dispira simplex]|nr:hypothetical protein IWQ61_002828 [Dispira simplex]